MNSRICKLIVFNNAVLLLAALRCFAQPGSNNFDKVWIQGSSVTFSTTFSGTSQPQNKIINAPNFFYFTIGNSGICDSSGGPIITCDGFSLYDKNLNIIDSGALVVPTRMARLEPGWSLYVQTSIILPFDNNKYRLVTPVVSDDSCRLNWEQVGNGAYFDQVMYDDIDMNANGGAGKVTKRMVPILQNARLSKTQMMACRHGDGKSWWLLKQAADTNLVYKFLFTQDKVYGPYLQGFSGEAGHFGGLDITGQSVFSPDGTKYATVQLGFGKVFVADFDRCSGMLSNPKVYKVPPRFSGNPSNAADIDSSSCSLAFSPNGKYLYVGGYAHIDQLALNAANLSQQWTYLSGPDTTWREFQSYETMYLGPDGRIYIGNTNGLCGQMSVINSPDNYGTAADFCRKCLRFPPYFDPRDSQYHYNSVSTPPCMPNYHLGPTNPICYPLGVEPPIAQKINLELYPNPINNTLNIAYPQGGMLEITDMAGRKIQTITLTGSKGGKTTIDTRNLSVGILMYRYLVEGKMVEAGKIVVQHE